MVVAAEAAGVSQRRVAAAALVAAVLEVKTARRELQAQRTRAVAVVAAVCRTGRRLRGAPAAQVVPESSSSVIQEDNAPRVGPLHRRGVIPFTHSHPVGRSRSGDLQV